jgi:hypothetical protein
MPSNDPKPAYITERDWRAKQAYEQVQAEEADKPEARAQTSYAARDAARASESKGRRKKAR